MDHARALARVVKAFVAQALFARLARAGLAYLRAWRAPVWIDWR